MGFQLAEAYVELSNRGFGSVMGGIASIGAKLTGLMNPIGLVTTGLAGIGGMAGIGAGVVGLVKLGAEAEALETQFETLLGSVDNAKKMVADLKEFGASTPFEFSGLSQTAKNLIAFGVAQDQVLPTLQVLGDMAAATGQDLNELGGIYGKIKAQGKLSLETVMQLQERSVPIIETLANQYGKTTGEIQKMVSEGKIGFGQVQQALVAMTGEGGKFFGGMDRQSKTIGGLWSTLSDEITMFMTDIGTAIIEGFDLGEGIASITELVAAVKGWMMPAITSSVLVINYHIQSLVGVISDVARNYSIYWNLMSLYTANFGINSYELIKNFGQNSIVVVQWLAENWYSIVTDLVNLQIVQFQNMASNLMSLWQGVLDFIAGRGFNVDFRPLTQGFESAIKELPQIAKANLDQLKPLIDAQWAELEKARSAPPTPGQEKTSPTNRSLSIKGPDGREGDQSGNDSRKRFQFVGVSQLAEQMQQQAQKNSQGEKQNELLSEIKSGINKLSEHWEKGMKLTKENAPPIVNAAFGATAQALGKLGNQLFGET